MLIPITGKLSWRNPPYLTISLIVINTLVFFIFQFNDTRNYQKAIQYYFESGLAKIEISKYIEVKNIEISSDDMIPDSQNIKPETYYILYGKMMQDDQFIKNLTQENVITPSDPDYDTWRQLRDQYNTLMSKVVSNSYGFIPAKHKPVSFLTYMFLHGDFMHLLGNMIFLWLVGCILEMGCGRILYLLWYFVGGIGAVCFFWLFNMQSYLPLIGASGAIAGLMGLFTVLFGFKKVKVFLALGVYFDYFKIKGIYLLPIWFLKEIFFQVVYSQTSNVAYMAHAGGIIVGALLGWVNLKFIGLSDEKAFEEEPVDEISPMLEKAMTCIEDLDMNGARRHLSQILTKEADHHVALTHLFNIEKLEPEAQTFHSITQKLLFVLSRHKQMHANALKIYKEYMGLTRTPNLSPELFLRMHSMLIELREFDESEKILTMLINREPDLPGVPAALLKFTRVLEKYGDNQKAEYFRNLIHKNYPDSLESQILNSATE